MRCAWTIFALAACSRTGDPAVQPRLALVAVPPASLCVTKGTPGRAKIDVPTFRAVAPDHAGDAAAARVVVAGASSDARALASGQLRRQLGLKLRAADGCNLIYAMWRLDPAPKIEVSVKRNPGKRTAKECGAEGYTKVHAGRALPPPKLDDGAPHEMRAELEGETLVVWIDGAVVWTGQLPASVLDLAGPAGVRSDNLAFELAAFSVDARAGDTVDVKCASDDADAD